MVYVSASGLQPAEVFLLAFKKYSASPRGILWKLAGPQAPKRLWNTGQFIDRVRVDRGVDLSKVTFELGESAHLDGSDFFRIDPKTGNIYLDESLEDHVDQEFYLFVKASTVDGPTSSLEVRVFVEPPDEGANGGPPRLSAPRPGLPFISYQDSDSSRPFCETNVLLHNFQQQKKEVSGEMNSVDTTDESSRGESSIVTSPSGLMHWHRALSNRYESTGPGEESAPALTEQSKWEFPRHHLRILGILGEGCFGQVWKCEALNVGEPVFVILEYVQHGKLQSYLRASRAEHYYGNLHGKSSHLTSRDLTSFAFQVSKGMDYLTSKGRLHIPIIHRDLAARNVLVGEKNICKVADFGFARDLVGNGVYERKSEGRLPIRWMAPESLYDNIFTAKTDVWSFGVLMWEIVTLGSTPYPGMAAGDVMRKVRDGYRLEKPDHCRREIYNIMYYCWDRDPKERPNFSELTQLLDQLLMSETDYIELDRFPDHAYYNIISNMSGEKL
ncbi:unnamed protein product [Notodromas monacha]|uniref:receptor protein-tyrosine kinase n=1 Tax=Notodromas monacha TaxID=399045 RepID=A0A7R9GGD0_9CRUS|nr:unnamed protein product [Notodromas monacha]CAG0919826.1 unnamed protein product [Notodromas monacha]